MKKNGTASEKFFLIRQYQASDRPAIEKISKQVQAWEKKFYADRALSNEIINRHVDQLEKYASDDKGVLLVAVDGEECIGFLCGNVEEDYLNNHQAFYINDMGVVDTRRGQGVGTRLLAQAEKIAREIFHLEVMKIGVICGNDGAEKLYRRTCYEPYLLTLVKRIKK